MDLALVASPGSGRRRSRSRTSPFASGASGRRCRRRSGGRRRSSSTPTTATTTTPSWSLDPVSLAFALRAAAGPAGGPAAPAGLVDALGAWCAAPPCRPPTYLAAVRRFAPGEHDPALVASLLDRAAEVLRRFVPDDRRVGASQRLMMLTALAAMAPGGRRPAAHLGARGGRRGVRANADLDALLELVDGGWAERGFQVDQEMRWQLAIKAVAHGLGRRRGPRSSRERAATPRTADSELLIRAEVSRPDPAAKRDGVGAHPRRGLRLGLPDPGRDRGLPVGRTSATSWRPSASRSTSGSRTSTRRAITPSRAPMPAGLVPDRWAEPAGAGAAARVQRGPATRAGAAASPPRRDRGRHRPATSACEPPLAPRPGGR